MRISYWSSDVCSSDRLGARGDHETGRRADDVIAVAHPDVKPCVSGMVGQATEQPILADPFDLGVTKLALVGGFGAATQLRGKGLHAVADAENRQASIEHRLRRPRRTVRSEERRVGNEWGSTCRSWWSPDHKKKKKKK